MNPLCRPHLLLAEDNDFNRQLAATLLEEEGYEVTAAEDGARALALFRGQRFDLILMDVSMPGMDGCEATRAIRTLEREQGGRIPIIALTAGADAEERQACLDSGMDDVLLKPFSIRDLRESLARCRCEARADAFPAGSPGDGGGTGEDTTLPPSLTAMLSDRILADFSAAPSRLPAFFELLCDDLGTQLAAMQGAHAAADPAALCAAAHAAKGVAQGLRDQSLSLLAGEIERQARQGDISGLAQKLADCMALYRAVEAVKGAAATRSDGGRG
ncbi:MAG TPA: response regulator [Desulfuromonadaceae bacterium]